MRAIDHVHVLLTGAAEAWYARVLGLKRMEHRVFWAGDGGPLTLANEHDTVHVALFERPPQKCRSTVAFGVSAKLRAWQAHLRACLGAEPRIEDHQLCSSLYFSDPDGNPYEITSYEHVEFARLATRGNPTT